MSRGSGTIRPLAGREQISAVIIAGGQSRRMGERDKAFAEIHGRPLIHWVIARLYPQVGKIFVAASPKDPLYQSLGLELLGDPVGPNYGPLAGVLAGLERAATPYVLTAPCDTPFLPQSLVARLFERLQATGARAVTASDGTRLHGTISLIDRRLAAGLRGYLLEDGRQVRGWLKDVGTQAVDFSSEADAFLNINTGNDIVRAESMPSPSD